MKKNIADVLEIIFIFTVIIILVFVFLAEPIIINGNSMYPTLEHEEQILTQKFTQKFSDYDRGDIVVFNSPKNKNELLVKRIIALPNETIYLNKNKVYINDQLINEPYLKNSEITEGGNYLKENIKVILKSDEYILMGDNRKHSTDSREFGPVKRKNFVGKAVLVYYPIDRFRLIKHVDSFFISRIENKLYNTANL